MMWGEASINLRHVNNDTYDDPSLLHTSAYSHLRHASTNEVFDDFLLAV